MSTELNEQVIPPRQPVQLGCVFSSDGSPEEPTVVVLTVLEPDGEDKWLETHPVATKVSTGSWKFVFAPTEAGRYWWKWFGEEVASTSWEWFEVETTPVPA